MEAPGACEGQGQTDAQAGRVEKEKEGAPSSQILACPHVLSPRLPSRATLTNAPPAREKLGSCVRFSPPKEDGRRVVLFLSREFFFRVEARGEGARTTLLATALSASSSRRVVSAPPSAVV